MVRGKSKLPKKRLGMKYTSPPAPDRSSSDEGVNPYLPTPAEKKTTKKKTRRDAPSTSKSSSAFKGRNDKSQPNDNMEETNIDNQPNAEIAAQAQHDAQQVLEDVNIEDANSITSNDEYEAPAPEASKKGKRKRAEPKKSAVHLTDEQTELMIEWLKCNPGLYDKRRPLWMQPAKKNEKWQDQARVIGINWEDLQRWFNTQRRRLGQLKIKSKVSGQGSIESEWKDGDQQFFQDWAFLQPHMKHVNRHPIVSIKAAQGPAQGPAPDIVSDTAVDIEANSQNSDNATNCATASAANPDESQRSRNQTPVTMPSSPSTAPPTSRRSQTQATDSIIHCLMSSAERHQELVRMSEAILRAHQPPEGQRQERFRFKEWVGEVLQELPQDLYDETEEEIYRVLTRYRAQSRQRQPPVPRQRQMTQAPINTQQPSYTTLQPSQPCSSQWQPAPQHWIPNPPTTTSVWNSQSCEYMGQYSQYQQQQTQVSSSMNRPSDAGSSDYSMTSLLNSSLLRN